MNVPKGITIEQIDSQLSIRTNAKQFGMAEKIATAFFAMGLVLWFAVFSSIEKSDELVVFSILISIFCLVIISNLVFINRKYQTIVISMDSIEVIKNRIVFSSSKTINRTDIEFIDLKQVTSFSMMFSNYSFKISKVVMMNLGYAEIPRIRYKGNNIYFFEDCNTIIKTWIVSILNS